MSYASEEEKAAWKKFCDALGSDRSEAHKAYSAEQWKRETPFTLTFEFQTEEDRRAFAGYMSDGGGEYAFMEGNRHPDEYGFSFLYHPPTGEGFIGTGVVKVIRLDREKP